MKKTKGIIIAFIVFALYILIMFFVFRESDKQSTIDVPQIQSSSNYYIVVGDTGIYRYYHDTFFKANKSDIESLNDMKVFIDNKYLGNYKLNYVSRWNLLNDKSEYVSYKGNLLAVSNNFDVVVRHNSIREINDEDKLLILKNFSINSFKYLTKNQVIDIDLDKNGVMDEVICLSSMDDSDNINNYYNLVLLKYNDEVITLVDERKEDAKYVYDIVSVINVLNNSNDSIILEKIEGYYGEFSKVSHVFINYENGNYVID